MVNQTKLTGKRTPKKETKPVSENGTENTNDAPEWAINGWLNRNKNGKSFIVSGIDGNGESVMLGFINVKQIEKLMNGDIKGTPIKMPPAETENQ